MNHSGMICFHAIGDLVFASLKSITFPIQDAGSFMLNKRNKIEEKEDALTRTELESLQNKKKVKKNPNLKFLYTPLKSTTLSQRSWNFHIEEIEEQNG